MSLLLLFGNSGPPATNYTLTAQGGSYSLSGQQAVLLRSKRIVSTGGQYTLSGGTATVLRSKRIVANGGSYALTGQQVTITFTPAAVAYVLTAQGGSYNLTGASSFIRRSRYINALPGTYQVTGSNATILRNRYLNATGGTYTLAGQLAVIQYSSGSTEPPIFVIRNNSVDRLDTSDLIKITESCYMSLETHEIFKQLLNKKISTPIN